MDGPSAVPSGGVARDELAVVRRVRDVPAIGRDRRLPAPARGDPAVPGDDPGVAGVAVPGEDHGLADGDRGRGEVGEGHHLAVPRDRGLHDQAARRHLGAPGEREADHGALVAIPDEDVHGAVGIAGNEVRGAGHEGHEPPVAAERRRDGAPAGEPATEPLRDERGRAGRLRQGGRDRRLVGCHGDRSTSCRARHGARGEEREDQAGDPGPIPCAPQGRRYPE